MTTQELIDKIRELPAVDGMPVKDAELYLGAYKKSQDQIIDLILGEFKKADKSVKTSEKPTKKVEKVEKTKAAAKPKTAKSAEPRIDHGKVVALFKAGWTEKHIAYEIGCTTQSVINHLVKAAEANEVEYDRSAEK